MYSHLYSIALGGSEERDGGERGDPEGVLNDMAPMAWAHATASEGED